MPLGALGGWGELHRWGDGRNGAPRRTMCAAPTFLVHPVSLLVIGW